MLKLSEKEWQIIKSILQKYPFKFYAYGSRVKNKAKKYSDLDLCYKEPIPDAIITKIHEEFEESNLPFKVELLNWHRCSPEFQESIAGDLTLI